MSIVLMSINIQVQSTSCLLAFSFSNFLYKIRVSKDCLYIKWSLLNVTLASFAWTNLKGMVMKNTAPNVVHSLSATKNMKGKSILVINYCKPIKWIVLFVITFIQSLEAIRAMTYFHSFSGQLLISWWIELWFSGVLSEYVIYHIQWVLDLRRGIHSGALSQFFAVIGGLTAYGAGTRVTAL